MSIKKTSAKTVATEPAVKAVKTAKVAAKPTAPAVVETKKAVAEKAPKSVKTEKTAASVKPEKSAKSAQSAQSAKSAKSVVSVSVKVTFTLPKEAAENAQTVSLLGDFNQWKEGVAMKKQKDGSFTASIELEKGRSYEYRFLINGEKWENAWNAEAYKPTPFGTYNSVVTA